MSEVGSLSDMDESGDRTAHSPCPRNQVNATVILSWKACTNAVAQFGTTILRKRHAITWCWRLAPKKRCPVIVKVLEYCWSINLPDFHTIEPGTPKEACQRLWAPPRKSPTLVELE